MSLTAANVQTVFDQLQSHALASGYFERVNTHEPKKSSPNRSRPVAALWVDHIGPAFGASGLAKTSVRLVFHLRIYASTVSEPQDAIDPAILTATAALMEKFTGDFTLGGNVHSVDALGSAGSVLEAQAGYMNQDGAVMRVMTITIPIIINDAWTQTA